DTRRVDAAVVAEQFRSESDRRLTDAVDPQRRVVRQFHIRQMKTESVRALHLNRAAPDDRAVIDGHDAESLRERLHAADAHRNAAWNLARESVLRRRASVAI